MKKFIVLSVALVMTVGAFAQGNPTASATATASANIIQPLQIAKTADLAFGNIASGTADGTVVIAVDGARTSTGGVTLIEAGNVSNAASFDVTGLADASFTIEVPTSIVIETAGGADQMTVDNFVSSLGADSVLDVNGEATLEVGATLNVSAQQAAGLYSGSFDVIVAYN
ncbi:MAG: DUF4402 domain-containing protein [Flavobacteriales bacterium]|nr:DUF4402 domain-containing protein [Flavobacteriales bacterium]MBL0316163.1 DUF4402 domain-containing protein [Flavobacteriales bacterium]